MIYLLDTNIMLYLLGGKLAKPLPKGSYLASVISEIELLSYPNLDDTSEKQIQLFLSDLTIIDIDLPIKQLAIKLRREHHLKLPDAIIVATALDAEAVLLSNDLRLQRISNLNCQQLELN